MHKPLFFHCSCIWQFVDGLYLHKPFRFYPQVFIIDNITLLRFMPSRFSLLLTFCVHDFTTQGVFMGLNLPLWSWTTMVPNFWRGQPPPRLARVYQIRNQLSSAKWGKFLVLHFSQFLDRKVTVGFSKNVIIIPMVRMMYPIYEIQVPQKSWFTLSGRFPVILVKRRLKTIAYNQGYGSCKCAALDWLHWQDLLRFTSLA